MKIIGITGGVGAGKSEILKYLKEKYQASVIEADKVGHLLMEPDGLCYEEIIKIFGARILQEDGRIDRAVLGSMVFQETSLLEKLNQIIHPNVKTWIKTQIEKEQTTGEVPFLVIEAALLLEDHYDEICDEIWYIDADVQTRTKRLKETRGYSEEKIAGIMANQKSAEAFENACPVIIRNDGTLADTYEQIDRQLGK